MKYILITDQVLSKLLDIMPRKSKANRQLSSARENARRPKFARTDDDNDVEFIEHIKALSPDIIAKESDEAEEEYNDADFMVDDQLDCEHHADEDNMSISLNDVQVAEKLLESINIIESRWRAVGENIGRRGTSRSTFYRKAAEDTLRSESVTGDKKITGVRSISVLGGMSLTNYVATVRWVSPRMIGKDSTSRTAV